MLTAITIGLCFVFGTIALIWAGYFLMRYVAAQGIDDHTKELAGSVLFRIAALHGLILALIFAQEILRYQKLEAEIIKEATAIADIYFDIDRHGSDKKPQIRAALSQYAKLVANEEWTFIGENKQLLSEAWQQWEIVYQAALDLEANTPRQASLREHMIDAVQKIAETRDQRESHGVNPISGMFWFAAVSGIFLVSLAYFCFPPTIQNLALISIFGAFTGIIMFFIYSFSNPYSAPGAIKPHAIERLLEGEIGKSTAD